MKRFTAIALAALMVLSFVSVASAADSVEVRGEVTGDADFSWDANNFAGFWIDLDTGEFSEYFNLSVTGDEILGGDLTYEAIPIDDQTTEFEFVTEDGEADFMFTKIGFLAEEFVVVYEDEADTTVDTLSKILMDDDESYTLRTGESLELADGYALVPKQIDVDGNKVWLELTKDGDFVEDKIISTDTTDDEDKTWYFQMDLNDKEDINVILIKVDEVFQGQVDSLAVIEGIFQISDDPVVVEDDDEFGELEVDSTSGSILMSTDTDNDLDVPDDDTLEVTDTLGIRANEGTTLWYLYTVYTEPGTYEIRSSLSDTAVSEYDANNFAGFWYDIDDGVFSEYFNFTITGDEILGGDLTYEAIPIDDQTTEFEFVTEDGEADFMFTKIGFLAEEFVVVYEDEADTTVDTLSKILMDDDESYTLRTGESLELADGYALVPKQIDVDGNKVWLELTKDGDFVEDKIISTDTTDDEDKTWYFQMDLNDKEDINVILIKVDEVFQGQVDSLAVIEGIFQISDDPVVVEDDDEFGELEVDSTSGSILMSTDTDNDLDMPDDDTLAITDTIGIKANEGTTLWYIYTEVTVDGDMVEEPEEVEEPVVEEPVVDENVTEPVVEENVTEPVEEPEEEPEEEPADEVPGFEAVFAIAGLLAVAYFVRRN